MKRRHYIPLICGVLFLVGVLLLSSCGGQSGREFDHLVTFNYNCGDLDVNCPDQYLGVMDGALVGIEPGYSDDFKLRPIAHHYVEGWYTARCDEDGNPMTDAATGRVLLDRKWDFSRDTVTADTVLYANLIRQSTLSFVDIATGETVKTTTGTPGSSQNLPTSVLAPKKDGYTLIGYYTDEAKTSPFSWPHTYGEEDSVVYVDFLEGTWTIADSPATFRSGISGNKNIYVTADIDFSDATWLTTGYNGVINGNGHKLTGIRLSKNGTKTATAGFGLFTQIGEKAEFHDLTIENLVIDFRADVNSSFKVSALADRIRAGAKFENFTLTGSLTYDISKAMTSEIFAVSALDESNAADVVNSVFAVTCTAAE